MTNAEPFDRNLRRIRRDRAASDWEEHAFLQQHIAAELTERLSIVKRDFTSALVLGFAGRELSQHINNNKIKAVIVDSSLELLKTGRSIQCDEDRLPFADESFDLVISAGVLDTVNDLPGALLLARRILKPDGLFLGGFLGAGSLPALRQAMLKADDVKGSVAARIHPQIDVRSAGDLLGRAGFALQVADGDTLTVRYRTFASLIADLRGSGNTSLLKGPPLSPAAYRTAESAFESTAKDGRTNETFEIVYMTGWAPGPDQPKPAARGSGTVSLARALKPET